MKATFWVLFIGLWGFIGQLPVAAQEAVTTPPIDTLAESRMKDMEAVLAMISGRESEPSGVVFSNIKILTPVPAGRLLRIMDVAYSQSLGVDCGHCHNRNDWSSDELRPKLATREMMNMMQRINEELLSSLEHLDSERPIVNCTTCHRGEIRPAQSLQR